MPNGAQEDVTSTLSELERKLVDLERELRSVAGGPPSGADVTVEVDRSAPLGIPAPGAEASIRIGDVHSQIAELVAFRDRLQANARELVDEYGRLIERLQRAQPLDGTGGPAPAPAPAPRPGPAGVAVSCGAMSGSTISFARGAPSLDIIDTDGLRAAADRAFTNDPGGTTAYGTSVGYPPLRRWIAEQHGVDESQVLVTNGSMQADAFLFDELVSSGDDVIVERPTYDRTLLGLRERGATIHAIELEPDGIDVDAVRSLIQGGARPRLAHIIPNFQNPAGYTLSQAKRDGLLALAREHGFLIFEDDPYIELRFRGERLPTMLSMDTDGSNVVYASSFSKTVCPGIRVGYLVGPTELIGRIAKRATGTYISPNMVAQSIVHEFCVGGDVRRSIETVKAALGERVERLTTALSREIPEAKFVAPDGGYFMWVELPEGTDVNELFEAAAARGVQFVKGTDFLLEGGENTLRLAYSGVTADEIDEGVSRLADALRSLPAPA
jgi:2-aminoadipate transaminase